MDCTSDCSSHPFFLKIFNTTPSTAGCPRQDAADTVRYFRHELLRAVPQRGGRHHLRGVPCSRHDDAQVGDGDDDGGDDVDDGDDGDAGDAGDAGDECDAGDDGEDGDDNGQ